VVLSQSARATSHVGEDGSFATGGGSVRAARLDRRTGEFTRVVIHTVNHPGGPEIAHAALVHRENADAPITRRDLVAEARTRVGGRSVGEHIIEEARAHSIAVEQQRDGFRATLSNR
jgi:hypothetical protein